MTRIKARVDEQSWIRCGECGHKLMKMVWTGQCDQSPILEVKCHSCKTLNYIWFEEEKEVVVKGS